MSQSETFNKNVDSPVPSISALILHQIEFSCSLFTITCLDKRILKVDASDPLQFVTILNYSGKKCVNIIK